MSSSEGNPWDTLNTRYGRDEDAKFFLFVEQLQEIRTLLLAGSVSKGRLALVAIDNLAEVVLVRHLQRIDELVARSRRSRWPRLTEGQRQRFHREFSYRVAVGEKGATETKRGMAPGAILDKADASIFLSGHAYRNRVYHADHHNEAALQLIAPVYAAAVGRAFVRLQPAGTSSRLTPELKDRLRAVGCETTGRRDEFFGFELFERDEAARAAVSSLLDDLQPPEAAMREALSEDLRVRLGWGASMVRHLTDSGMPLERFIWAVDWSANWERIQGDAELVRLDTEIADLDATALGSGPTRDHNARAVLNDARNKRIQALFAEQGEAFDLGLLGRIEDGAARLGNAKNIASLFERYRTLDEDMEAVERRIDAAAISWDRFVEHQTDVSRGK